jgi:hypothetical protein
MKWQRLESDDSTVSCQRAAVPGGWIVMIDTPLGSGITFYPDAGHEWDGKSPA